MKWDEVEGTRIRTDETDQHGFNPYLSVASVSSVFPPAAASSHVSIQDFLKMTKRLTPTTHQAIARRATRASAAAFTLLLLALAPCARGQEARPGQEQSARVREIQSALRASGLDGWLFYDFRHSDPLAYRILKLPEGGVTTRRWFYFVSIVG